MQEMTFTVVGKKAQRTNVHAMIVIGIFIFMTMFGLAQETLAKENPSAAFVTIPLGVNGGLTEDNLSSYLLAPKGDTNFIALDAGTLLAGLRQARIMESFQGITVPADSPLTLEGWVLQNQVKAYLISHAHVDHIAGLISNSPDDSAKEILGLASTIDFLRDSVFNWKIWPNFGDEGEGFLLKKYHYVRLTPGAPQQIKGTAMTVTPFALSHSNYTSTAFLMSAGDAYVLYFGDTGPDEVEKSDKMQQVWTAIAPLMRDQKLHGIFLEVSYPDGVPDKSLFGHLTPSWMIKELQALAQLVNPQQPATALAGLTVFVTHIKPVLKRDQSPVDKIAKELEQQNNLGVKFIIPEQGERIEF
jgi:3',5'-cyclic-nucleotide phosphodiesterase